MSQHDTPQHTCDAECGRIGNWHRCGRRATIASNRSIFTPQTGSTHYTLYFCERHATNAQGKDHVPCITIHSVSKLGASLLRAPVQVSAPTKEQLALIPCPHVRRA